MCSSGLASAQVRYYTKPKEYFCGCRIFSSAPTLRRTKAERPSEAQSDTAPAVERRQDATAEIKIIDKNTKRS